MLVKCLIIKFIFHSRVFFEMPKNDNNANIGGFVYVKTKKTSNNMLLPVSIKPRPLINSDSKYNTLLSGLN